MSDKRDLERSSTRDSDRRGVDDQGRGPGALIAGVILIGIGVVFLFQHLGYQVPGNWWSLFLLIPALASLASAWRIYERNGRRYVPAMTGSLIAGLVLIALTAVFLFDMDVNWGLIWPLILIGLGLAALARAYWRQ
jgi:drug/metabolite transporter (DMT)-like permease